MKRLHHVALAPRTRADLRVLHTQDVGGSSPSPPIDDLPAKARLLDWQFVRSPVVWTRGYRSWVPNAGAIATAQRRTRTGRRRPSASPGRTVSLRRQSSSGGERVLIVKALVSDSAHCPSLVGGAEMLVLGRIQVAPRRCSKSWQSRGPCVEKGAIYVGTSGHRVCALCGRHGMDTPRNRSHSRFGNERPGQVGGYWSSGGRSGIGVFCLGCETPPKRHDAGKLKGRWLGWRASGVRGIERRSDFALNGSLSESSPGRAKDGRWLERRPARAESKAGPGR